MALIEMDERDEQYAVLWFGEAGIVAQNSTCLRRKCGAIIVNGEIIGSGFNSPPGGLESQRRCLEDKSKLHEKVTDKTCCVHAEERAIVDALRRNPSRIEGSTLYFTSVNKNGEMLKSGRPYCTICSKLALDVGIEKFALWHNEGIRIYTTEEYNRLSYKYSKK